MATRSPAEDELWRQEVASWDYLRSGNLRAYLSLLHSAVTAWPRHAAVPLDKDAIFQRLLPQIALYQSPGYSVQLTPLSVRVFGDVGVAQYRADIHVSVKAGLDERLRFTRTWLRTENGWKLIAGMNAPVADP